MAFFSRRTLLVVLAATSAMTCESFSSPPSVMARPSTVNNPWFFFLTPPPPRAPAARRLSSKYHGKMTDIHPPPPPQHAIPQTRTCPPASFQLAVSLSTAMEDDIATDDDDVQDYLLEASDLLDGEAGGGGGADEALPASYVSLMRIAELRSIHRRHESDTGSPQYQVAGMTERISHLTTHLRTHPKDFSTRRGLVALVNKRRRLLNYLYEEDEAGYKEIVGALGIRHRVPGAIPSKEDQYGEFPGQKANRGKSKMKNNKRN